MSPVDNSTPSRKPISLSAPPCPPSLARVSGASLPPYPPLAPRRAMHHIPFVPRPFPPPALADVPLEYIIAQLRRLASHYWSRPETSDCTIGTCAPVPPFPASSGPDLTFFACPQSFRSIASWPTRCTPPRVYATRSGTWGSPPPTPLVLTMSQRPPRGAQRASWSGRGV